MGLNFKESDLTKQILTENDKWGELVKKLKWYNEPVVKKLLEPLNSIKDSFTSFANPVLDMKMWSDKDFGQILFSDNPGCTVNFNHGKMDANGNPVDEVSFEEEANLGNLKEMKEKLISLT